MQSVQITEYACDVCGYKSRDAESVKRCERKPVSGDKGAKVGSRVRITSGGGAGELGTVDRVMIFDREWGHYMADRYHHTIGLQVKMDNGLWRQVTMDDYEMAK